MTNIVTNAATTAVKTKGKITFNTNTFGSQNHGQIVFRDACNFAGISAEAQVRNANCEFINDSNTTGQEHHWRTSERDSSGFILLIIAEIRLCFSEGHVTNTNAARDGVDAFVTGITKTPANFHDCQWRRKRDSRFITLTKWKRQCHPQPCTEQQRQRYISTQRAFTRDFSHQHWAK
ncbi:hypothetical protein FRC04_005063 [Tulasnella sp. 424]|nr:hypothetical protein FRC04_005063 [Tulasnella sp. 424]